MPRVAKRNRRPTFHFNPANMIQGYIYLDDSIQVIETRYLLQYLEAAVMSDNQLEEAIANLIKALQEAS